MFVESRSLGFTNFPETIWPTNLGGIGKKPVATTNDCCSNGRFCENKAATEFGGEGPALAILEGEGAMDDNGVEKVDTKEGTKKGPTLHP